MRDRLIELIESAENQRMFMVLCCTVDELIDVPEREEYVAEYLLANGVTVQKWISVKDRLPEEGEDVLTYRGSGYRVEALESVSRKYWENDIFCYYPVTHWMPLPQPPKGE